VPTEVRSFAISLAKWLAKLPIHAYRWSVRPLVGWRCRHLPTCSDYALEAIEHNGAWRGGWLALSRVARCHPWGTYGYDPVPDIAAAHHPFAPWRYGRWRLGDSAGRAPHGTAGGP
jgi:putative membrane protein insertion efficiency factor